MPDETVCRGGVGEGEILSEFPLFNCRTGDPCPTRTEIAAQRLWRLLRKPETIPVTCRGRREEVGNFTVRRRSGGACGLVSAMLFAPGQGKLAPRLLIFASCLPRFLKTLRSR